MIDHLLNQPAKLYSSSGMNSYGKYQYVDTPIDILVRYEGKINVVKNSDNEEIVTKGIIYTTHYIKENDKISINDNPHIVIAISFTPGYSGNVPFYKAYV